MSLTGKKKKKKVFRFPKKARGHSMCSTMVGGSWRLAVGGWRLAVGGGWQLVAVGGGWRRLVAGGWWLEAVGSGWQLAVGRRWQLAAVGGWRLVAGGWWRLAVDGSWRLAVGGPLGLSLRAVLSKKKKKSRPLRTPLVEMVLCYLGSNRRCKICHCRQGGVCNHKYKNLTNRGTKSGQIREIGPQFGGRLQLGAHGVGGMKTLTNGSLCIPV